MPPRAANSCSPPARCSPGRYLPKLGARRRPRPTLPRHHSARRARRARDRRAGRRSGLGALRGDEALTLDGKTPALQARRLLRAQSGDAEPATHVPGGRGDHRSCLRHALSRALAFRRPGFIGKRTCRNPALGDTAGSIARWPALASRRPRRPERQPGLCRRSGDAAGGARPGAGFVVVAAAGHAGER